MPRTPPICIWRKLVTRPWLESNEWKLHELTGGLYAVIERVGKQRLLVEVASRSAHQLEQAFGGRSERLSRDWLNEMIRARRTKPIRVGKRLVVTSDERSRAENALII